MRIVEREIRRCAEQLVVHADERHPQMLRETPPRGIRARHHAHVGNAVRAVRQERLCRHEGGRSVMPTGRRHEGPRPVLPTGRKPRVAVNMRNARDAAAGPESNGRARVSHIYGDQLHFTTVYVPATYSFGCSPGTVTVAVVFAGIVNVHVHLPASS